MSDRDLRREEWAIYLVGTLVSLPVVLATLIEHDTFEAGATISLVLFVTSSGALLARALRSRRTAGSSSLPSAQLRQSSADKVSP